MKLVTNVIWFASVISTIFISHRFASISIYKFVIASGGEGEEGFTLCVSLLSTFPSLFTSRSWDPRSHCVRLGLTGYTSTPLPSAPKKARSSRDPSNSERMRKHAFFSQVIVFTSDIRKRTTPPCRAQSGFRPSSPSVDSQGVASPLATRSVMRWNYNKFSECSVWSNKKGARSSEPQKRFQFPLMRTSWKNWPDKQPC